VETLCNISPTFPVSGFFRGENMMSRVQQLAEQRNLTSDDFIGEMRKRGCSEPTAIKIWQGLYEDYKDFTDNDLYLSNLRKAADVLRVTTGTLLPK
jgi:hypothetical protein